MASENLGASFTIDISNLKAGITQANRLIRESESEFKAASAGLDEYSDKEQILTAKKEQLTKNLRIQNTVLEAYEKQMKEAGYASNDMSKEAVELRTKINNQKATIANTEKQIRQMDDALEELQDSSDDAGESLEDAGESAKDSGEGFTVAKGAIANLISDGFQALVGACKNAIDSFMNLAEETREYREDIGKLETAFEAAGKSTELATEVYKDFYSVLGEEDRSVEAVNHLAKFVDTEEDMAKWTDICTGVWGTFGDSLPIEGLTEAANETAKVGKVTGVLADALNWAGVNEDDFNDSLANCTDESERASLITETLNGLYKDAANHYKENNKSIMEARRATSDYTDAMADMGEELEPVNTAISQMKTEFIQGLVPVIKQDVIPEMQSLVEEFKESGTIKKFSDSIAKLAKSVLPVVSKAVKFLAENLSTIVTVTYTAITAFTALKAAMAITTAIRAAKTAIAGLTTGIGLATKAQTVWNAVMSANPIGLVLTAVGLLTGGIAMLVASNEDATESTEELSESQEDAKTAAEEAADAYKELRTEAANMARENTASVDYLQGTLLPELQNLVDANGLVKEGYEARANFILNELNTALGTEYDSLTEIINANGEIEQSVYDVIEAKKAQIMLEAYEDSYREAIIEVTNAEMARAEQSLAVADAQRELSAAEDEMSEKFAALKEQVLNGNMLMVGSYDSEYQAAKENVENKKAKLDELQTKYDESELNIQSYYDTINGYEQASTLIMQGETDKAIDALDSLGRTYGDTAISADMSANDQLEALAKQVTVSEENLRLLEENYKESQGNMTDEEKAQAEARILKAKEEVEDSKEEFKNVGTDIAKGIADGSTASSWYVQEKMRLLMRNMIQATREEIDSNSPSKKYKKLVGLTIGQGIAVGIDESTSDVLKSVKDQMGAIEDTYDLSGISQAVDTGINIRANGSSGGTDAQAASGKNVTVYQTNNYSQAHSRYELYKSKQQTSAAVRLALGV